MAENNGLSHFAFAAARGADWDDCAEEYVSFSKQIGFYGEIRSALLDLIPTGKDALLDFGCADGVLTRTYLDRIDRQSMPKAVYLVDQSPRMLNLTSSLDGSFPDVRFTRVCDSEEFVTMPPDSAGTIDVIMANSSVHLCHDPEIFFRRASTLLRPGGWLLANIPDQDFEFEDGWKSQFRQFADQILPWPAQDRKVVKPKFSKSALESLSSASKLDLEVLRTQTTQVSWEDFVNFYSIPFMGTRRLPTFSRQDRVLYLKGIKPVFRSIEYRWAICALRKRK